LEIFCSKRGKKKKKKKKQKKNKKKKTYEMREQEACEPFILHKREDND